MQHRAAALAVCLLALASSVSAQCSGNIKLELVSTSNGAAAAETAKCLSSVLVSLDAACAITLTSTAAGGNFVPALWTPAAAATLTYKQYMECPVDGAAVAPTDGATSTLEARQTALATAFSNHIYGAGKPVTTTLAFAASTVTATVGSATFTYIVTEASSTNLGVGIPAANTGLPAGTFTPNITAKCDDGRYGIILSNNNVKVCPVCPAGTTGDGNSCSSCAAGTGKDAGVGDTTCAACDAGTYAAEGSSDCLPCPPQTYSGASAGQCEQCPTGSYAWVPGSKGCLRCIGGKPTCIVGTDETGVTCTSVATAASAGFSVLTPAQLSPCALTGAYAVPAYDTCASWKTASVTLKWSIYVAGDCSIVASPITDTSCSEPGNATYNYASLQIRSYYQTTKTIRSLLPAAATAGGSSAFLMSLDSNGEANQVSMVLFAATSNATAASGATALCNNTNTVSGGSVAAVAPATATDCAAGSSYNATTMCPPCATGSYCPGGASGVATSTPCGANTTNPYLGQNLPGACTACPSTSFTSTAGSAYCTVPYINADCADGSEYEPTSQKCVPCKAGTFRAKGNANLQCQDCAVGTYSAAGATACTDCPAGQYSPTTGLAEQSAAVKCLVCPAGSLALNETQTTTITALTAKAVTCDACPAGYVQLNSTQVCSACASGTYRSGDAAPENNVCKAIPAGYKANAVSAAVNVTPCANGTVSYYNGAARVPATATECEVCGLNTYAPRTGMANCLPCKGGSAPLKTNADSGGPDDCAACTENTFRSFYTALASCAACGAGTEVGPSGRQACTQCRPGTYKPASGDGSAADFCAECPINKFSAGAGSSDCEWCARGYETVDTGSTECTPCSIGYYSAAAASTNTSNCVAAPAGSYVNTTAAFAYTLCSVGSFSKEAASDNCDPCSPGQYANTPGSKSCKTCQAGTFSSGSASACRSCQAGYYAPAGSSQCSPCRPGFYTSMVRSGTCALCPKGKQCPTIATATPKDCPRGYFSAKEGSRLCSACPVNTIAATIGAVQCTPCAAGTSTRGLVGQSACQAIRPTLRRSTL